MRRLLIPLALFVLTFTVAAQVSVTGGIGPANPILLDTNGDGKPDAGDTPLVPVLDSTGTNLTFPNPCGTTTSGDTLQLIAKTGGKWSHFRRVKGAQTTDIVFSQFVGGAPTAVTITDVFPGHPTTTGNGNVIDKNSDGIFDQIGGVGGIYNVLLDLVFADTKGTGFANFVSVPWSLSSQIGVKPGGCGSSIQPWIPIADTNGDGKPDAIVLDLNGDGFPDPPFFQGPPIGPVAVAATTGPAHAPTLSQWAMILLAGGLAFAGWWYLRSQNLLG